MMKHHVPGYKSPMSRSCQQTTRAIALVYIGYISRSQKLKNIKPVTLDSTKSKKDVILFEEKKDFDNYCVKQFSKELVTVTTMWPVWERRDTLKKALGRITLLLPEIK